MAAPRRLLLPVLGLLMAYSPRVALASRDSTDTWAVWSVSQLVTSHATLGFSPPNYDGGLGYELHASFIPPHRTVGLRIELGMTEHSSPVNNVMVDNPYRGVEVLQSVEAGSRLSWAMVGAQWDPRPRDSGIYLYAMVGGQVVSPMEKLGDGYPVIEADVPGLPERNGGLASAVGIGSRLRLPFRGNLALTGEFDYHNLGHATYVTYPGLEGDYPNTHYTVTAGPVETWNVRFGLAVRLAPRR